MEQIKRFLFLSVGDKARFVITVIQLLLLPVVLSHVSFSRVRTVLTYLSTATGRVVPGSPTPQRLARTVELADSHLSGERTCLVRSLTTETLLLLYGHTFNHRIGVKKSEEGAVEAHSWIEINDEVLIGELKDLSEYSPLPALDGGDDV